MYRIDCSNKLRKKSAYCWSLLSKTKNLLLAPNVDLDGFFGRNEFGTTVMSPTDSLPQQVLYVTVH